MYKLLHYFYSKTDVILEPFPGLFENFRLRHFKVSAKNISIWKFLEKDIIDPKANIHPQIVGDAHKSKEMNSWNVHSAQLMVGILSTSEN